MRTISLLATSLVTVAALGCSSSSSPSPGGASGASSTKTDAEYQADIVTGMHDALLGDMTDLITQIQSLCDAAPSHAWDPVADAAAISSLKDAWKKARTDYEHIEGAVAPIFPNIDYSIDARYDDVLSNLGATGDPDLFDDQGFTGLHAIERIVYSDQIPARIVMFESTLPGYVAASFPTTDAEASEFKTKLCARAVADAQSLHDMWQPAEIDLQAAFSGLVSLCNEQQDKVDKAASSEEESRYSQRTMADLRDNRDGSTRIYALFSPWIVTKQGGKDIDAKIQAGFQALGNVYAMYPGDALPVPPPTWSSLHPSQDDLATPFGMLFEAVHQGVDPSIDGSIVFEFNRAADALGYPKFEEP